MASCRSESRRMFCSGSFGIMMAIAWDIAIPLQFFNSDVQLTLVIIIKLARDTFVDALHVSLVDSPFIFPRQKLCFVDNSLKKRQSTSSCMQSDGVYAYIWSNSFTVSTIRRIRLLNKASRKSLEYKYIEVPICRMNTNSRVKQSQAVLWHSPGFSTGIRWLGRKYLEKPIKCSLSRSHWARNWILIPNYFFLLDWKKCHKIY